MKILFIGSVIFSKKILTELIKKKFLICGVITKSKSNFNSDFYNLKEISKKHKIDFLTTENINNRPVIKWIKNKKPDLILCCGWSQLISKQILKIPTKFSIGYHPSDLPNNRGRHPIIWALALGLKKCYSCFFVMNEYADSGYVLDKRKVAIDQKDDAGTLYQKLNYIASKQIVNLMNRIIKNKIKKFNKINIKISKGNIWRKRYYKDGIIDWRMNAENILNLIRSLIYPYPNAQMIYRNKMVKVLSAKVIKNDNLNLEPGKVLKVKRNGEFLVKTGKDSILVKKTEPKIKINDRYL